MHILLAGEMSHSQVISGMTYSLTYLQWMQLSLPLCSRERSDATFQWPPEATGRSGTVLCMAFSPVIFHASVLKINDISEGHTIRNKKIRKKF